MASDVVGGTADPSGNGQNAAERNPDTLPTSRDQSGVCPRCGRTSNFDHGGSLALKMRPSQHGSRPLQQVVVLVCQGCGEGTAVIEEERITRGALGSVPLHWWPVAGAVMDVQNVPADLADAFQEGVRCVGVEAPHAAVAMFRNALAHIVRDKGSEAARSKGTLNAAIQQMVVDRTLYEAFDIWATRVRQVGNAGAHQESWEPITLRQASELQDLTRQLIEFLYVQPAELENMLPPVKKPKL